MKIIKNTLCILIMFFFVSVAFADATWNETYDPPKKIKVTEEMNFRSGPGTQYSRMEVVKKGTVLSATSMKDGWYEIPLERGGFGYIYKRFVTPIDSEPSNKNQ